MGSTLFVLKNVNDFAPGAFENTAVEDGSIRLGRSGGSYLQSGCYTSPAFKMEPFLKLIPSWNACTPKGTAVEVQVRMGNGNHWSRWFSFGKWSPFIRRASPELLQDEIALASAEMLSLADAQPPATMAQIRIYLYSDDSSVSPKVHLLAVAADPVRAEREEMVQTQRQLRLPSYSCLVRDPSIALRIASPTTLAMLMNRWGEDTLPEEVARASYDYGAGRYGNMAFCSAIAGAYGYECYVACAELNLLRQEVRRGHGVGAQVHYRPPTLGEEKQEETINLEKLPILEEATASSQGHFVAVQGFERREQEEWVMFNDPYAEADDLVVKEMPMAKFAEIYTSIALVLHKGPKGAGANKPERRVGRLEIEDEGVAMYTGRQKIYPGKPEQAKDALLTVAYTLPEGVAYASAAQKKFYYLKDDETGKLHFNALELAGQKATFYFIGDLGQTWVAEKVFPQQEAAE